jgi:tetratricopeptide (TPR) repeat protein
LALARHSEFVVSRLGVSSLASEQPRIALLQKLHEKYLLSQDASEFITTVSRNYTTGTLERLLQSGSRLTRRASALALGFLGGYEANAALGRALQDADRGVRSLADNGIRHVWCRAGNEAQRQHLGVVIRLNVSSQHDEAVVRASELIERAPWFAEAWNQRAIACFHLGRFRDSIRDCHQALEINPYHFGAAAGMGQCHLQLSNPVAALECFRRAVRLNPDLEGVRAQVIQLERVLRKIAPSEDEA